MTHKDKDSEHADCKAHDAVVDKGGDAVLNINAFQKCREHCLSAKTSNLKKEE